MIPSENCVDFECTTDASGHSDIIVPLPAGTRKIVGGSIDLKSVYGLPADTWDQAAAVNPAVGNPNLPAGHAEAVVTGAPGHYYTGHLVCA